MLRHLILLFCLIVGTLSDDPASPRIVIIGAGASGIAAASRLLENGFKNVLILEAENRIGGRVNTVEFDDYLVDLGGQWVHGQKGNVAYDLAKPLDLIEHSTMENQPVDMYTSSGEMIDPEISNASLYFFRGMIEDDRGLANNISGNLSFGEYFEEKFQKFLEEHPSINETMRDRMLWQYNLFETGLDPADDWYDVSAQLDGYEDCEGDRLINWKERGYSTILDVLMKKIPNPEEELPVLNNTILNAEVVKIDYTNDNGPVKITTQDGKEYLADHVIVTVSLGVLKADHETLFDPPLPEYKVTNIKNIGFGTAAKLILAFNESWWEDRTKDKAGFCMFWNMEEKDEYEKNPDTQWIPSLTGLFFVQYKPRLLLGWISGKGARLMEDVPDDKIFEQSKDIMNNFLSKDFNVTEPIAMKRTNWYKNKHFRGTYSYRSLDSDRTNSSVDRLAEPIEKMGKPVILFGGEATNKKHYATVNGAIGAGWREAERLISHYNSTNTDAEN